MTGDRANVKKQIVQTLYLYHQRKEVEWMAFGTIGRVRVWTTKSGIKASVKPKKKGKKGKK